MKKKVKKIPKYSIGGTVGTYDPNMFNTSPLYQPSILNSSAAQQFNQLANNVNTTLSLDNPMLYNYGQFQKSTNNGMFQSMLGNTIGGAGVGAMVGGVPGAIVGGAIGLAANLIPTAIGTGGSVNQTTGDITYASGISRLFGRSDDSLIAESNRIKNTITNRRLTQDLNQKFASDPSNNMNTNIYATAAEGGIMRQPVDALISKGELIYNPVTKKLSKVPGSKGKPNKSDDVYARLNEGDVVISNSPTMLMANGKTPAQNLEGLVDSNKNQKAKEAIIKKVVNWQEANKTKPQEYAKYSEGIYYVDGQRAEYRHGRWWWNEGGKKDAQGKMYFVPYTGKSTPSETEPIKHTSEASVGIIDPAYLQHVRYSSTINDETKEQSAANGNKQVSIKSNKKSNESKNVTIASSTPKAIKNEIVPDRSIKINNMGDVSIPKKLTPLTKEYIDTNINYYKNNIKPQGTTYPQSTLGLDDYMYRAAVLSQPLWGNVKPESVKYTIPNAKSIPVHADPTPLLRSADESYNIGRYNASNMTSGQGIAYSAQLASDRAKRYADTYKWQNDVQNQQIAQNVGIYNDWDNKRTAIMNSVYDKDAANRASARNINRKNYTSALNNYGQMLRDDKLSNVQIAGLNMYAPAIQAVMENPNSILDPLYRMYR